MLCSHFHNSSIVPQSTVFVHCAELPTRDPAHAHIHLLEAAPFRSSLLSHAIRCGCSLHYSPLCLTIYPESSPSFPFGTFFIPSLLYSVYLLVAHPLTLYSYLPVCYHLDLWAYLTFMQQSYFPYELFTCLPVPSIYFSDFADHTITCTLLKSTSCRHSLIAYLHLSQPLSLISLPISLPSHEVSSEMLSVSSDRCCSSANLYSVIESSWKYSFCAKLFFFIGARSLGAPGKVLAQPPQRE